MLVAASVLCFIILVGRVMAAVQRGRRGGLRGGWTLDNLRPRTGLLQAPGRSLTDVYMYVKAEK